MRLDNDVDCDRLRRVLLLSKRLDEFANTRRELVVQLEHNSLLNVDAPTSRGPEDMLILKAAMHSRDRKRLDELSIARHELLRQLVDLDVQESAARREHNSLCNLGTPISRVPAEVLAMIFEEGIHAQDISYHFGVRVSHVAQYWRDV